MTTHPRVMIGGEFDCQVDSADSADQAESIATDRLLEYDLVTRGMISSIKSIEDGDGYFVKIGFSDESVRKNEKSKSEFRRELMKGLPDGATVSIR